MAAVNPITGPFLAPAKSSYTNLHRNRRWHYSRSTPGRLFYRQISQWVSCWVGLTKKVRLLTNNFLFRTANVGESRLLISSHILILFPSLSVPSLLQLSWTAYKYLSQNSRCGLWLDHCRGENKQSSFRIDVCGDRDDKIHPFIVIVDINNQSSCRHRSIGTGKKRDFDYWIWFRSIIIVECARRVWKAIIPIFRQSEI